MIKKKNLIISALTAMLIVTLAVMCFYANTMGAKLQVNVRNVELNAIELDYSSIINQFENAKVTKEGSVTTFEGYQTLDASLFEDLDNVSESDIESSIGCQIKYNFTYDSEANIVTLSAIMENGEKLEIEEIYGSAFIDENGRLDAVMDFDGEYVLLSEMQDMGLIQNCGWFSRLFKKVVKAVVAVAAVAVCVATAGAGVAAVIAIGAAVGAAESVATQLLETGTVCLGAVLVDTALGAIPGGTGAKTVAKESIKAGAEIAAKKAAKEASEKAAKETAEKTFVKIEGRGSTGRTVPNNLIEDLAMKEVKSNPLSNAKELPIQLKDERWLSRDGWVKMERIHNNSDGSKTIIHFVYNKNKHLFDDFKFKN